MASGYFPRLYAVFPRPNAAFASSRRAAAGSGAAAARPPPTQPGNDVGSAVVTSVASTAAATARPVLPIAATLHARASSWNICLRCSLTPAYRFARQRARSDVVSRKGTDSMSRPGFSCDGGGRGAIAMAIVALASAAAGCKSNGSTPLGERPDAAVTFQSGLVTRPATWQNLWGSWPFARYWHSMVYDSNRKLIVMYGGQQATNGPYYDETWEWDGARGVWNEKTPAPNGTMNTSPAQRTQQMMVFDTVQKKSFMFSGWQPQASFYIPDQWEWDGTTWTERVVTG